MRTKEQIERELKGANDTVAQAQTVVNKLEKELKQINEQHYMNAEVTSKMRRLVVNFEEGRAFVAGYKNIDTYYSQINECEFEIKDEYGTWYVRYNKF